MTVSCLIDRHRVGRHSRDQDASCLSSWEGVRSWEPTSRVVFVPVDRNPSITYPYLYKALKMWGPPPTNRQWTFHGFIICASLFFGRLKWKFRSLPWAVWESGASIQQFVRKYSLWILLYFAVAKGGHGCQISAAETSSSTIDTSEDGSIAIIFVTSAYCLQDHALPHDIEFKTLLFYWYFCGNSQS